MPRKPPGHRDRNDAILQATETTKRPAADEIRARLTGILNGTVQIIIQDGYVIQIDSTERCWQRSNDTYGPF